MAGVVDRMLNLVGLERRDATTGWELVQWGDYVALSKKETEGMAAAFACVDVICSAISALPPLIEKRNGNAWDAVDSHPLDDLLVRPNAWQAWPDFIQWLVAECLWEGNGLAVIEPDGTLEPVRWTQVQPLERRRRPIFEIQDGEGRRRMITESRAIHLADRSDDGRVGVARRKRAGGSLELAYRLMRASRGAYRNSLMPSGALSFQRRLTTEQKTALRSQLTEQFGGDENTGAFLLLDDGATWTPVTITPRDGDLVAAREQSIPEICRVWEVPPPLVQDYTYNTFTNSTQAGLWFAQFTLAAWVRKIEAVLTDRLMGPGYRIRLDMASLMRGDVKERWDAYDIALERQVLTPEQVRRMEGWAV